MGNLSHLGIGCARPEFDEVLAFYLAALKPLGYKELMRPVEKVAGLGNRCEPEFWNGAKAGCGKVSIEERKEMGIHFAFWGKGESMMMITVLLQIKYDNHWMNEICPGRVRRLNITYAIPLLLLASFSLSCRIEVTFVHISSSFGLVKLGKKAILMLELADHAAVHAFHAAALKAGGTCNGKAGYRPEYVRYYYAAFVMDPLGNNVEMMCIHPAWTQWWWWRSLLLGGKEWGTGDRKED